MGDWCGIDLRQRVAAIRRLCWPYRWQASSYRFCGDHDIATNMTPCRSWLASDGVLSYADELRATQCC